MKNLIFFLALLFVMPAFAQSPIVVVPDGLETVGATTPYGPLTPQAGATYVITVNPSEPLVMNASGLWADITFDNCGPHWIYITSTLNGCSSTDSALVQVNPGPPPIINPGGPVCQGTGTYQLTATPLGGTWSGPGIDPVTGVINLTLAAVGNNSYSYSVGAASCPSTSSITFSVTADPNIPTIGTSPG